MRYAAWFLSAFCAVAFSQNLPPENAAGANLQNRLTTLKLLGAPARIRLGNADTGTCAIPLLNATPSHFASKMPVMKLPPPTHELTRGGVVRAMPACDEKFFRNQ